MKKNILILFTLCLCSFFSFAQDSTNTSSSKQKFDLPSVNIKTLDGAAFNTSQFSNDGKPIIINFWATWCTNCVKELKAIQEVYGDWQDSTGVKLIAVSIDDAKSVDKVKPFVNGKNWDYEIYLDPNRDFSRAMNVVMPPYTFVLDGNGKVVWQHITYTDGDEEILYKVVKQVAAGQEITE
jgi:cytochrome c biogenesis protein CcmG, thiol:disulfide interchange protein DsbE